MATTVRQLADRYEVIPSALRRIAEQYPGSYAVRNDVGNLAIMTRDGTYLGFIDVLAGEVEVPS